MARAQADRVLGENLGLLSVPVAGRVPVRVGVRVAVPALVVAERHPVAGSGGRHDRQEDATPAEHERAHTTGTSGRERPAAWRARTPRPLT